MPVAMVAPGTITEAEVRVMLARLEALRERAKAGRCYCESNAADHRGACHFCCLVSGTYQAIRDGEALIGTDPLTFFIDAAGWIERVERSFRYRWNP